MADGGVPPIRRIGRRLVYENQWLTLFEDATDVAGCPGVYSVLLRADAAVVVITSHSGEVLMVNSFRYPTGRFSLELPMGAVDPGESPEEAAVRELREETGITAAVEPAPAGWFFALPGLTGQRVYVYTATVPDAVLRTAYPNESEPDIDGTVLVRIDDLPWLVATGRITDSVTLCGLALTGMRLRA